MPGRRVVSCPHQRMLRVLDRYVIRSVLPPLLMALLVFTFMLVLPFLMELAETLISKGVPFTIVLSLMWTLVPQSLAVTIPMALLVGLLVGLGRLSSDREWVALQACGVGIRRLLRPVAHPRRGRDGGDPLRVHLGRARRQPDRPGDPLQRRRAARRGRGQAEGLLRPLPEPGAVRPRRAAGRRAVAGRVPCRHDGAAEPGRLPGGPRADAPGPAAADRQARAGGRHAAHEQGRRAPGLQRRAVPRAGPEPRPGNGLPAGGPSEGRP